MLAAILVTRCRSGSDGRKIDSHEETVRVWIPSATERTRKHRWCGGTNLVGGHELCFMPLKSHLSTSSGEAGRGAGNTGSTVCGVKVVGKSVRLLLQRTNRSWPQQARVGKLANGRQRGEESRALEGRRKCWNWATRGCVRAPKEGLAFDPRRICLGLGQSHLLSSSVFMQSTMWASTEFLLRSQYEYEGHGIPGELWASLMYWELEAGAFDDAPLLRNQIKLSY